MNRDIKLIRDAVAREGKVVGNSVVVPADFFDRLNANLNAGRTEGFVDAIVRQIVEGSKP